MVWTCISLAGCRPNNHTAWQQKARQGIVDDFESRLPFLKQLVNQVNPMPRPFAVQTQDYKQVSLTIFCPHQHPSANRAPLLEWPAPQAIQFEISPAGNLVWQSQDTATSLLHWQLVVTTQPADEACYKVLNYLQINAGTFAQLLGAMQQAHTTCLAKADSMVTIRYSGTMV